MTWSWQPQQFQTLYAFGQYLATLSRPSFIRSVTLHHTWKPLPADWRGMASMAGLGRFYRDVQGWPAGPHLFLCIGAPNPANDGIFVGTPLSTQGVHAGVCNSDRWGIEIVGNYDLQPWPIHLADLVYGVVLALAEFGGFDPATVNGHRECNSPKTCPGRMINMNAVRMEVKRRAAMVAEPNWQQMWGRDNYAAVKDFGFATEWRKHIGTEKAWGQAVSDEIGLNGSTVQFFMNGMAMYTAGRVTFYRIEKP